MDARRIIVIIFFSNQLLFGCERTVFVWNLAHISEKPEVFKTLLPKALKSCGPLLEGKSWKTAAWLALYAAWIAKKGQEIEKGDKSKKIPPTFGIGNIVSKLIPHINACCANGEKFTSEDIVSLCKLAIDPQMTSQNIFLAELIQGLIIKGYFSMGICNYDPLEQQITALKLAQLTHPLCGLCHAIIGVLSESHDPIENPFPEALNNFVPSPEHYPSEAFLKTIKDLAAKRFPDSPIVLIDTEQPDGLEKYGIQFKSLKEFLASGLPNR